MKKFIGAILVSVMSFSLLACGSENTPTTSNSNSGEDKYTSSVANIESTIEVSTTEEKVIDSTEPIGTEEVMESEEQVSASTDINSYISGDYFDINGYLEANGGSIKLYDTVYRIFISSRKGYQIILSYPYSLDPTCDSSVSIMCTIPGKAGLNPIEYHSIMDASSGHDYYNTTIEDLTMSSYTLQRFELAVSALLSDTSGDNYHDFICPFCENHICNKHYTENVETIDTAGN